MDLGSAVNMLKQWCTEHQVEERSVKTFWQCVRGYQVSNHDECLRCFGEAVLDETQFRIEVTKVSLSVGEWPELGYPYVMVYIPIVYRGRDMGMYRSVFTLSGEDEEDYFTIDPMPKRGM